MAKIKKITLLLIAMVFGFALATCSMKAYAIQQRPLKIEYENSYGDSVRTYCVIDDNTGVNYVVVSKDNYPSCSVSVCPRYNADGSLYTSK